MQYKLFLIYLILFVLSINSLNPASQIEIFDTTSINNDSKGFIGSITDGQYLYLVPFHNGDFTGVVTRYNTKKNFNNTNSWESFDTAKLNNNSKGFQTGNFDGQYIYFIPQSNGKEFGQITRFNTNLNFNNSKAWEFFDITPFFPNSKGFVNSVFDGRNLYLIPYFNGSNYNGKIVKYKTNENFYDLNSWEVFDLSNLNENAIGFQSASFDGKYIYFTTYSSNKGFNNLIVKYDIKKEFTNSKAWEFFDLNKIDSKLKGYIDTNYDGKYIYFIPNNNGRYFGTILRYNTNKNFNNISSWEYFDITKLNKESKGFRNSIIGNNSIYLIPFNNGKLSGVISKYNTNLELNNPKAWEFLNTNEIYQLSEGYLGSSKINTTIYLNQYRNRNGKSGIVLKFNENINFTKINNEITNNKINSINNIFFNQNKINNNFLNNNLFYKNTEKKDDLLIFNTYLIYQIYFMNVY